MKSRQTQRCTLTVTLRPLRLAFIVNPDDKDAVLRAIQINSILWGGALNPILPAFRRSPQTYTDGHWRGPTATQILSGYLAAYDPDFVVLQGTVLPGGVSFDRERVISTEAILGGLEEEGAIWYGVGLNEIISHLHTKEFQFTRRHPAEVVCLEPASRRDRLLVAACFGELPTGTRVDFHRLWSELLEGKTRPCEPTDLFRMLDRRMLYPLQVGMHSVKLDPRHTSFRHGPSVFWMDATSPEDVVDYWNLRASDPLIFPLPVQWAQELKDAVRQRVECNHQPDRINKQFMHWTSFIKSRHTSQRDLSDFLTSLHLPADDHMVSVQHWVPRIHDEWGRAADGWDPCRVVAEEQDIRIGDIQEGTEFETIFPKHAEKNVFGVSARYANVVRFQSYGAEDSVAAVIPPGLELGYPQRPMALSGDFRAGRDGLTLSRLNHSRTVRLPVPNSWNIFSAWLSDLKFSAEISDGGRVVQAMLECLGGIYSVKSIQGWWLVDFLNRVAMGSPVSAGEASSRLKPPRDSKWRRTSGGGLFNMLVERGVLEVGAEIQCSHCRRASWFSLEQIGGELTCSVCTRRFPFPALNPPRDPWRYRPVGPFSLPQYGAGCYSVLLALHFLTQTLHASVTMAPSFNLAFPDGDSREIDFGILWRDSLLSDTGDIYPIFGECKSLNAFVQRAARRNGRSTNDVSKMRKVGKAFPGAVLVFATLAEDLHPRDRLAIAALARFGRKPWRGDRWLNPVLVLTRRELMSFGGPPECWEDVDGPVGDLARSHRHVGGILDLCDLTQQLYLGLPPRHEWLAQQSRSRAKRLQRPGEG